RVAEGASAADRVADQDHPLQSEAVEEQPEQLGVAVDARGYEVRARVALAWPVEGEDTIVRGEGLTEVGEIAGAVADAVQANDGRPPALVVVRQSAAGQLDLLPGGRGADGGPQGGHTRCPWNALALAANRSMTLASFSGWSSGVKL